MAKKYYVSLVQNLVGYCVPVEVSDICTSIKAEKLITKWANDTLGRMWCAIYTEPKNMQIIGQTAFIDAEGYVNYL